MDFYDFLTGRNLFDGWIIGAISRPNPLDVTVNAKNRFQEANKRDFNAVQRQLRSAKRTRRSLRRGQDR